MPTVTVKKKAILKSKGHKNDRYAQGQGECHERVGIEDADGLHGSERGSDRAEDPYRGHGMPEGREVEGQAQNGQAQEEKRRESEEEEMRQRLVLAVISLAATVGFASPAQAVAPWWHVDSGSRPASIPDGGSGGAGRDGRERGRCAGA